MPDLPHVYCLIALALGATLALPLPSAPLRRGWALLAWGLVGAAAAGDAWPLVLAGIAGAGAVSVVLARRRVDALGAEAFRVYKLSFGSIPAARFERLLAVADWIDAAPGDVLIHQGNPPEALFVIARGQADVQVGGNRVASLPAGSFLGEMGWLTGQPAGADVLAGSEGLRAVRWERAALDRLFRREPELRDALRSVIGLELVDKLRK